VSHHLPAAGREPAGQSRPRPPRRVGTFHHVYCRASKHIQVMKAGKVPRNQSDNTPGSECSPTTELTRLPTPLPPPEVTRLAPLKGKGGGGGGVAAAAPASAAGERGSSENKKNSLQSGTRYRSSCPNTVLPLRGQGGVRTISDLTPSRAGLHALPGDVRLVTWKHTGYRQLAF
jgi:hypothetical protein